jgi:signal transduction histidine kinase
VIRGQPLALRLAALLAGVAVVVLLLAGLLVNQIASRSVGETLSVRDQQRLGVALAIIEESFDREPARGPGRGGEQHRLGLLLRRMADESGGVVRVRDSDGSVRLEVGSLPAGADAEVYSTDLSAAAGGGSVEVVVPSAQGPVLRAFNTALVVTGIGAVVVLFLGAAAIAGRLTRPLRAVTGAAERLRGGDLSARAQGGPDAESGQLADAFNAMAERLERSEALRRRAASDLAHDLATPATLLGSQLQAMTDGIVPADAEQLDRARASAETLSGVIRQLGELTQAEAAPLLRRVERVDLGELAREVVASLDELLRREGVRAEVAGAAVPVEADRGQLERVVRNVVTNAIQHAPAGSAVRIGVEAQAGTAVLRVSDRGAGIAAEDVSFVFERFYRADRSRGRPGAGIGLTVARELVTANGGTIEVEGTGHDGTTFRIELPAAH